MDFQKSPYEGIARNGDEQILHRSQIQKYPFAEKNAASHDTRLRIYDLRHRRPAFFTRRSYNEPRKTSTLPNIGM